MTVLRRFLLLIAVLSFALTLPLSLALGQTIADYPELERCGTCRIVTNEAEPYFGSIKTSRATLLYLIPLDDAFQINRKISSLKLEIKAGMSFEIARVVKLEDSFGSAQSYGLLANSLGGKFLGLVLLETRQAGQTKLFYENVKYQSPVVTYIGGSNDLYPNKVENLLHALKNLSDYQDLRGGFKAHRYVSALRGFGFYTYEAFTAYKPGKLTTGQTALAGGVCAAATSLASLAYQTEDAVILDIVHHDLAHQYFQGPFSPPKSEVDSGISYRPDGSFEELGLSFPTDGYFGMDGQLIPSGLPFAETDPEGLEGKSDLMLIYSIYYQADQDPKLSTKIEALLNGFTRYRSTGLLAELGQVSKAPLPVKTRGVLLYQLQKLYTPPSPPYK